MTGGANLPLVSSYNRSVVLDAIRSAHDLSRVELAAMTGLTGATVSNIVRRLIDEQYVVEMGQSASTGGKPRTLLRINPTGGYAVGVQIDVDTTTSVLTDLLGAPLGRQRTAAGQTSRPATVIAHVARDVRRLVQDAGIDPRRVVGVGVATPGPIDHARGMVLNPPNMGRWQNVPLREELERLLHPWPVLVDNDATVAAMGERWAGGALSSNNFACIYMGTGIGAGIFVGGQVCRGTSSNSGEIGHISLDPLGELCFCGNRGCVELFSAPPAVVAAARARVGAGTGAALRLTGTSVRQDYARIGQAVQRGDPLAVELISRAADFLGYAVVTLTNLFDLDLVVLAGPAFARVGPLFLHAVQRELAAKSLARDSHAVEVRLSEIAEDVGSIGAASLVLHSEFAPRLISLKSRTG
ncbi:ROK family transcriptional regulator [Nakamurella sp. PAMC28650]|jgi:predicted NBD/HSP70 family sugar kinase|uniref:ROK family transcriptional regulator n=1 Tax=Nakamurella sp. PAMC28650 TaxID=2762325 RepID=UPI00164E1B75|nr:ROK family transcriptional regulator [Nakamurella sp. PAMC28650]QNK79252.1 ROK family transcriptional regulator [Nakamurella sp. PAMC28650]